MAVEMKAGPELDRAVAEAIGWSSCRGCDFPPAEFRPSIDLNSAFVAAELIDLFQNFVVTPAYQDCEAWGVWTPEALAGVVLGGDGDPIASYPTAALAICGAILELTAR